MWRPRSYGMLRNSFPGRSCANVDLRFVDNVLFCFRLIVGKEGPRTQPNHTLFSHVDEEGSLHRGARRLLRLIECDFSRVLKTRQHTTSPFLQLAQPTSAIEYVAKGDR